MVYDIAAKLLITDGMEFEFEGLSVEIVRFSHMWLKYPECIDYHAHINYEFHYISKGNYLLSLEENEFEVQTGQAYICPPFMRHRQRAVQGAPSEEYCVECKLAFNPGWGDAKCVGPFLAHADCRPVTDESCALAGAFAELEALCEGAPNAMQTASHLFGKASMLSIIMRLIALQINAESDGEGASRANLNHMRAIDIKNYLDANLTQPVTVQECALIFALSPRQIDRIMLKEFNYTFYKYLMWMRVNVASNLVETTHFSVDEIAERAGFTNYRQMIRCFKMFDCAKPSELRRGASAPKRGIKREDEE